MAFEDSSNQSLQPSTNTDRNGHADLALVRAVLAGDSEAADRFLDRMRLIPRVLSSLSKRDGAPLAADVLSEVSQEVFARVWAALPKFGGLATLETWVYRFCVLTLFDHRRGPRTESRGDFELWSAGIPDGSHGSLSRHDAAILHAALARLLPEETEIVEARHFRAMTFDEAAVALSISQGTLKTRYYRAMSRLRVWLRRAFGDNDEPNRGADGK